MQRNLVGNKYGNLTVISMLGRVSNTSAHYYSRVRCDCGNEFDTRDTRLIHGSVTKCHECWKKSQGRHHMTGTPIHNLWLNMRQRCSNPNSQDYKDYGGRGIRVCDEWNNSFESFYEWATTNGYEKGLSIDRIDVNGNYEPENCRFANAIEQGTNKRNNVYLDYEGETVAMSEASRRCGISEGTLGFRLRKGWNEYDATHKELCKGYETTIRDMAHNITYTFHSLGEASLFIGMNKGYLSNKLAKANSNSIQIGGYYVETQKYSDRI